MQNVFTELGLPEQIVSDHGPCYIEEKFQDMCKSLDIHHLSRSPHHHQVHGLAEKYVGILKNLITKTQETGQSVVAIPKAITYKPTHE